MILGLFSVINQWRELKARLDSQRPANEGISTLLASDAFKHQAKIGWSLIARNLD
jgi:hypothetical protein